jgi:uncharacterized protein (UPF0276 family)
MREELGVGLAYHPALEDFVHSSLDAIDVLEIDSAAVLDREGALEELLSIPCSKTVRGISVGSSRLPDPSSLDSLRELAAALHAKWVTGELAFDRAQIASTKSEPFDTGLRLPLRQTVGGARLAAHSVRSVRGELRTAFSLRNIENYLKARRDEIGDAEFLSEVVEDADCGISLDLGTLWINAANGRGAMSDLLEQIPLERVWDLRLGSGRKQRGYGFGARPGAILDSLLETATALVPRLGNLRAIFFEIHPNAVPRLGASGLSEQLGILRSLWERRGTDAGSTERSSRRSSRWRHERSITPREWEDVLGALVVGKSVEGPLADELNRNPGLVVTQQTLAESRASAVAKHLALTSRLVAAAAGPAFLRSLLEGYWKKEPPLSSEPLEALRFGRYLANLALDIPYISEVLEYERAVLASRLDGERRVVSFQHDPEVVLGALARGRVPGIPGSGLFEVEVASA